ncbi:tripartite tricarboxylate transporter substrate binding protein [bacterium]|nr:tripartite tricarboxylate transporter substrate binding protein [bacterium]
MQGSNIFQARRSLLAGAGLAVAAALVVPPAALAQLDTWPTQPVRLVVNFPPGSSPDVLARAMALPLQQALGQTVLVENRAGATGIIGAEMVVKAPADGYTLLMTAGSTITTSPFMYPKIPYDSSKDLVPVAAAARVVLFLVVRPDLPVNNVQEFLDYLKARPGKLSYGSAGNGSGPHLAGEMLKSQAGVFAVHVPYRGASPALQDLLAGQIDFYFDPGIALSHVRAGKLRMLAVAVPNRSSLFPDIPTLSEAGLKGFDAGVTHGFYAPRNTPPEVIARLNREINRILTLPNVRSQIATLGAEPTPLTPAQFAAQMNDDSHRFAAIIKEHNIRAD